MSDNLRINTPINNDIIFSMPVIDADKNAVNTVDQTLYINIKRLDDNKWWDDDTSTWISGTEPSPLIPAIEEDTTGIYKYTLSNAYEKGKGLYQVHLNAIGTVDVDYYFESNLIPKSDMLAVDSDFDQATKLKRGLKGTIYGRVVADSGNSLTQFKTNLTQSVINVYKNRVVTFIHDINTTAPADEGESVLLKGYNNSTKIVNVSNMQSITSAGDEFVIT